MNPTREQGRALAGAVADVMERYGADEYRQEIYLKFDRGWRQSTPPATLSRHRRMFPSEHAAGSHLAGHAAAHRTRSTPQKAECQWMECRWTFRVRHRN